MPFLAVGNGANPISGNRIAGSCWAREIRIKGNKRNGHATSDGHTNGHAASNGNGKGKATASQVRAIHAIASRQGLDLAVTLQERYGIDHAEDLGIGQASELIDELKVANGVGGRR